MMMTKDKCLYCPMYEEFSYCCKLYSFYIPARYNDENAHKPEWCEYPLNVKVLDFVTLSEKCTKSPY